MQMHEYMVKLEETCRDFKLKMKDRQGINTLGDSSQIDTSNVNITMSEEKVEELQRANKILMRSKEV